MQAQMVAYLGDAKIKTKYLKRVQAHYKADEIIHGIYWENGKGCAVGCTIEGSQHSRYETELGIPQTIAYLEDRIFEGLSNGKAKEFPVKFLKAIKPGADLSLVTPKFMVWMLKEQEGYAGPKAFPDVLGVLRQVAALWQRVIDGDEVKKNEWSAAAGSAESAARAAAESAAVSAWSAAWSAESAESAWSAYEKMAEKLLSL
jgi:hypothetical protein